MAGLGNYRIACNLQKQLITKNHIEHYPIEKLVGERESDKDFKRYEYICRNHPWLLHIIYGVPLSYWLKYIEAKYFKNDGLNHLVKKINNDKIQTVIAVNHRAALWVSALKHQNLVQCKLHVYIPDYHFGSGWKFLLWEQINQAMGPFPKEKSSLALSKYTQWRVLVDLKIQDLAQDEGSPNQILITGGGWGLGPLAKVTEELFKAYPYLNIDVICGNNRILFEKLSSRYRSVNRVNILGRVDSLAPYIQKASVVVTRPGASTLTESIASGRKTFIIKGLPGSEQANQLYFVKHFGAEGYNKKTFSAWITRKIKS